MIDSPMSLITGVLPIAVIQHTDPTDFTQSASIASNLISGCINFDVGQVNDPTLSPGQWYLLQTTSFTQEPSTVEVGQSPGSNTPPSK